MSVQGLPPPSVQSQHSHQQPSLLCSQKTRATILPLEEGKLRLRSSGYRAQDHPGEASIGTQVPLTPVPTPLALCYVALMGHHGTLTGPGAGGNPIHRTWRQWAGRHPCALCAGKACRGKVRPWPLRTREDLDRCFGRGQGRFQQGAKVRCGLGGAQWAWLEAVLGRSGAGQRLASLHVEFRPKARG